jgi:uncharacterized membrane protein (DUF485 family)
MPSTDEVAAARAAAVGLHERSDRAGPTVSGDQTPGRTGFGAVKGPLQKASPSVPTPLPPSLRAELDELARLRTGFILPLLVGGLGAYFLALAAYAYWPSLTSRPMAGAFNVAYLLAIALFLMTFAIGASYARWASRVYDGRAAELRRALEAHAAATDADLGLGAAVLGGRERALDEAA